MTSDLGYLTWNAVKGPDFFRGSAISDAWVGLGSLHLITHND